MGVSINQVSDGYFEAFGITLAAGRMFTPGDLGNSARVVILNETAAHKAFGGSNPLGRRVSFPHQRVTAEYEVVGIVRDTRYASLRDAADAMAYAPVEQAIDTLVSATIAIRARNVTGLESLVRRRMRATIPGGFMTNVATLEQQVDESLIEERLLSILASLFGALALLLAAIGVYGTLSYAVIRRTREIGIRIAVGAERTAVLWLVFRQTLALAGAGLVLGIPLVFLGKRYIESELFGLGGSDPVAIAGAAVVLVCVALAAGSWPAWRASRMDPTISLRHE
jgi:ABC-type antimicrobial peptide transport system permease subunit